MNNKEILGLVKKKLGYKEKEKCGCKVIMFDEIDDTACDCYRGGYLDGQKKEEEQEKKIKAFEDREQEIREKIKDKSMSVTGLKLGIATNDKLIIIETSEILSILNKDKEGK